MFKTLLRKNMQEVGAMYFRDKRGGKKQGTAVIGMIILYVIVFFSLALSFAGMAALFFGSVSIGSEWIVWSVMGIMAVVMSSVLNAILSYTQLYLAHDNEMLIAMPVPPGKLLMSRMVSVYVMGLVYAAAVWLPVMFIGITSGRMTAITIVSQILTLVILGFLILALTCIFGWLVAFLATGLKNQKFVTVIVCLLFLIGIYILQFKTNTLLNKLASNMNEAGEVIRHSIYPFYKLGQAACGSIAAIAIFTLITAVILAAAYLLVSKTYIKLSTTKKSGNSAKFRETQIKVASVSSTLLKKEAMRFVNSVTCMLNTGLGVIIMLGGAIFLFAKGDMVAEKLEPFAAEVPAFAQALPLVIVMVVCMMESVGTITGASVSLEGRNIWMLQSMPVEPEDVLFAKIQFGVYLEAIPGMLLAVACAYALGLGGTYIGVLAVFAAFFGRTSATLGTVLNLKHPNLEWTSEQAPVKQGAPVVFVLFGGWAFGMIVGIGGFLLRNLISADVYIAFISILLILICQYLNKWIKTRGSEIFRRL